MDSIGISILKEETKDDIRIAREAIDEAKKRFMNSDVMGLESGAFHLVRFYNAIEQMSLRIAKAFENHIDDERGWHTELVQRLSLEIPGVRPLFWPRDLLPYLREVRGFHHLFVHAYELNLDRQKTVRVEEAAIHIDQRIEEVWRRFFESVNGE